MLNVQRREEKHTDRKSQSNYSAFNLACRVLTRSCFLSYFFSLTPSSSLPLFLPLSPSRSSFQRRKLEMQKHIVTVGCSHLHSHLWHGQASATNGSVSSKCQLNSKPLFIKKKITFIYCHLSKQRWSPQTDYRQVFHCNDQLKYLLQF